jgi:L-fucose isomerase-like protein
MFSNIKIGVIPTRRNIFSKEEAQKQKILILAKLDSWGIDYIDINDINPEGLLFQSDDLEAVIEKLRKNNVDALFFPHCNFGTEYLVGQVANEFNLPVLLWGPRDDAPLPDGRRTRDSQCGLFATGKVLRHFRVKFNYIPTSSVESDLFQNGFKNFIAAANVVKSIRNLRILQLGTRPAEFWTTMCNEAELLEKFNIQIRPVPLTEFVREIRNLEESPTPLVLQTEEYINSNFDLCNHGDLLRRFAAMKVAMRDLADQYGCKAIAIQCWYSLQEELGVMPCLANSLLYDEGIPVTCETDIHGAITSVMAGAACFWTKTPFIADMTIRNPENDNSELLYHCGSFSKSIMAKGVIPKIGDSPAFRGIGTVQGRAASTQLSILRFDGDNNEYSLLLGKAKGIDGPYSRGTYMWIEVENLPRLEKKLVIGPYIHHCIGIQANILPVLTEAMIYFPDINLDFYDQSEEEIENYLLGLGSVENNG